jgi:Nitrate/nitrite transporter
MDIMRRYINLFAISLGAGCIYKLVYIKDVYYSAFQQGFGITNVQIGFLLTSFAMSAVFCYLPGGWLVDFIPVKYLLSGALISTGLLGIWESTFPSYTILLIIHMGYGISTTLLFWEAMIKGTRMLAHDEAQGGIFGMLEGIRGLCATLASFGGLYFFSKLGEGKVGLSGTMVYFGVLLCAIGIFVLLFMRKNEVEGKVDAKKALQGMCEVAKLPKVWLAGGIVFCGYTFYNGLSYMTPMLTNVFGMSSSTGAGVSIVRQYMIAIFAAPLGGFIADKIGSRIKFLKYIMIVGAVIMLTFIGIPCNKETVILGVGLMLITAAATYMMRGTYYSTTAELGVSVTMAGAAAGVISLVGNLPDFFITMLYGAMLDMYGGVQGYKMIFAIMMFAALLGCVFAVMLARIVKKEPGGKLPLQR